MYFLRPWSWSQSVWNIAGRFKSVGDIGEEVTRLKVVWSKGKPTVQRSRILGKQNIQASEYVLIHTEHTKANRKRSWSWRQGFGHEWLCCSAFEIRSSVDPTCFKLLIVLPKPLQHNSWCYKIPIEKINWCHL